jgi:hypothetical protein
MKYLKSLLIAYVLPIFLIAALLFFTGAFPVLAQDPIPVCGDKGAATADCDTGQGEVSAEAGAFFTKVTTTSLKGGYVAHGVGMRNTGYGTIKITDVPAGSSVKKAYLFWSIIGPDKMTGFNYNKGLIN